jgi:hypothetical protein
MPKLEGISVDELARQLKMDCYGSLRVVIELNNDDLRDVTEEFHKGNNAFVKLIPYSTGESWNGSEYDVTIKCRVERTDD